MSRTTLESALAIHRAGDLDAAETAYTAILAVEPEHPKALAMLGVLRLQHGHPAEAVALLERALIGDPDDAKAWNNLGNALAATGRTIHAVEALERAAKADPTLLDARANRAILLRGLARLEEAEAELRALLPLRRGDATLLNNLGSVIHALGRKEEAEALFREAVQMGPNLTEARLNLGIRARETGNVAEAECYLADLPGGARLLRDTALPAILGSESEIDEVRMRYDSALDHLLADPPAIGDPLTEIGQLPQFYLGYHGRDDRHLQEKLARLMLHCCPELAFEAAHCRPRAWQPGRRLRLGIVSAHLYGHTIGKLFGGLVGALPRDQMDVLVFSATLRDDAIARGIAAAADKFIRLGDSLANARPTIAAAKLDVLFYPDIGMDPFVYYLAFARLAPLQVVTWGHPVTTGLPTIDWFLSAEGIEPPGAAAHYSERLALMAKPTLFYRPPPLPSRPAERTSLGLRPEQRLYLCPQSLFKLHPGFDRLVAGVLRQDPSGIVMLIDSWAPWRAALEARFRASIPDVAGRIRFVPAMPQTAFIALCAAADVLLDVPTWAGGNTTLEALAVGTPVVTLPGAFMRGRLTAGLLDWAGLSGIATDEADYVARAVATAGDPEPARRQVRDNVAALYGDRARPAELAAFVQRIVEDARGRAG